MNDELLEEIVELLIEGQNNELPSRREEWLSNLPEEVALNWRKGYFEGFDCAMRILKAQHELKLFKN